MLRTQYERRLEAEANQENIATPVEVPRPTTIRGIGKLEPHSGIFKIYAPQGQRVDSLYGLKVGDLVEPGQKIVKLSSLELRELELKLANAKKLDAERQLRYENTKGEKKKEAAQLAVAEASSIRDQIQSKSKSVDLLRQQLEAANQQYARLQNLKSNQLTMSMIGQTDLEKQRLLIEQLDSKIEQAEDEIRLGNQQADRAVKAAQVELEAIETALVDAHDAIPGETLNSAIAAAEKGVELSEIESPVKGHVLDLVMRPGDTATNQPVMLLGDTNQMVCVAEINDVNFRYVEKGVKATISSIALDQPITGEVISRGIMIGPPSMKDPNPFASVDRKTGKVVIKLDDNSVAKNFVNLQVEVEINLANGSTLEQ